MVAFENLRPPFPLNTPPSIAKFIEKCWSSNPDERTSFEDMHDTFNDMFDNLSNDERRWIQSPIGHPVYDDDENIIGRNEQQQQDEKEVGIEDYDQTKSATSIYSSVIPQITKKKMKKSFGRFFSKKS